MTPARTIAEQIADEFTAGWMGGAVPVLKAALADRIEAALTAATAAQEAEIARLLDALTLIATSGASRGGQTTGPMKSYQMIAVAQEALKAERP